MSNILGLLTKKLHVFTFRGIPLYLHATWLLLFVPLLTMSVLMEIAAGNSPDVAIFMTLNVFSYLLIAYCSVIPHEYGHALTAKKLGYDCKDITLYPIGGLASISGDFYENWKHEFWITVNGPLVNVFLALVAWPLALAFPTIGLFEKTLHINVVLLGFNLLPLHPMDGGRILRSLLAGNLGDAVKATIWTRRLTVALLIIGFPFLWMYLSPVAALIVVMIAGFLGGAEARQSTAVMVAKQSKEGGFLQAHTEEWQNILREDAKQLFPEDEAEQEAYVSRFESFHEWMGRVYMILASRSSGKEEVRAKAEKVMECLKGLEETERLTFNTMYIELGEQDDDPGFKNFLTERFLEKHQLI